MLDDTLVMYGFRKVAEDSYEMFTETFGHWVEIQEAKQAMKELYGATQSWTAEEYAELDTVVIEA